MKEKYTKQEYWNKVNDGKRYCMATRQHAVIRLIDEYVPDSDGSKECFEIGCCPCRFLTYMGVKKKYIINGIDYSDGMTERLDKWLRSCNQKVGKVYRGDFFEMNDSKKYDFVYSCGFIEHFENYKKVISMHVPLVKKGGYLVITTPNFRGRFQYMAHKILDRENLERHNIASMNPEQWKRVLEKEHFKILYCGYFGGIDFWVSNKQERGKIEKNILNIFKWFVEKAKKKNLKDSREWSPYIGIVAVKE